MDEFLKELVRFGDHAEKFTALDVVMVMGLSFVLSLLVAWIYRFTHRGISYSQTFAHTLVIMGVVVALIMLIIGSNIARAFALVGALSIIRFRNAVKESRDVAFVFLVMAVGMACGTRFFALAAFSAVTISAFIVILFKLDLFAREFRERILRAEFPLAKDHEALLAPIFEKFADDASLVSLEAVKVGELQEVVYTVKMKKKAREEDLLSEVRGANENNKVTLVTGFHEIDL